MSVPLLVNLGKNGDVINILPFAYMMSKKLGQVDWLVGRKWASLLEGCSYVRPIIWEGTDDDLPKAIANYRNQRPLWVTQCWRNPDQAKTTGSFTKEQWRYVGMLPERGKWPLLFDNRSPEREQKLIDVFIKKDRPNVLVGTTSVSTPYKHATRLLDEFIHGLPDANIIPLDVVQGERLYDLLGLYDAADLLITVDTCHTHLVRAAQCPAICLINDLAITGPRWWHGAIPPPQTIAAWGYTELGDDLSPVVAAARNQLDNKVESLAVVIQTYPPRHEERHKRAMATHPKDAIYSVNDSPPTTKHLLGQGLDSGKDAVVFTHDDVTFKPDTLEKIKTHLNKFEFGCSRRPRDPVHIGREIFWFRSDWLRKNWDAMPDPFWSVQRPDLILARWMRQQKGIPTTDQNLLYDFPPVELSDVIIHEDHPSHWTTDEILNSMEGQANERLWEELA